MSVTYSLLATAVSVPWIMSLAASTSLGPYSSGMPKSWVMTQHRQLVGELLDQIGPPAALRTRR